MPVTWTMMLKPKSFIDFCICTHYQKKNKGGKKK